MADKTFREQVEEIVSSQPICHTRRCVAQKISCTKCRNNVTNAICEAVLKMAGGMPHGDSRGDDPVERMRTECQDYLRKQVKE